MAKKKKPGRPAGIKLPRNLMIRVDDDFYAVLDDWRRKQPDIPSRAEAIRRLVMATGKRARS